MDSMFLLLLVMTVSMPFSPHVLGQRFFDSLSIDPVESLESEEHPRSRIALSSEDYSGNYLRRLPASELLGLLDEQERQPWMSEATGPLTKRAPWAPSEIRVDEFVQKLLRSRGRQTGHSKRLARRGRSTIELRQPEDQLLKNVEEADRKLATLGDLITALEYSRIVNSRRSHQHSSKLPVTADEIPADILADNILKIDKDDDDDIIMLLSPKDNNNNNIIINRNSNDNQEETLSEQLLRRPSESFQMMTSSQRLLPVRRRRDEHPVYFGMGQNAAESALSTFARLQAENEKRIEKNSAGSSYSPSSPVNFIGK